MMLKIIATGSSGNCYLLEGENETLIIELGVRFSELKKALDYDFSNVAGAIITHEHLDHSKGLKEALDNGINCYASNGTFEALKIKHHNATKVSHGKTFLVGGFKILPFNVHHDVKEPLGFLIEHKECGRVLFITDTIYCDYTFKGLNNIIIEANYSEEIIKQKLGDTWQGEFLKNRILKSHMSLKTCINTLSCNDLSKVNNLILIHLSDSNSDERIFKKEVEEATGKMVTVAKKNQSISFNKIPF